jgi:hypothetical protein
MPSLPFTFSEYAFYHLHQAACRSHAALLFLCLFLPALQYKLGGAGNTVIGSNIVDVKNGWRCDYTPPYIFTQWSLLIRRENFTFKFVFVFRLQPKRNDVCRWYSILNTLRSTFPWPYRTDNYRDRCSVSVGHYKRAVTIFYYVAALSSSDGK